MALSPEQEEEFRRMQKSKQVGGVLAPPQRESFLQDLMQPQMVASGLSPDTQRAFAAAELGRQQTEATLANEMLRRSQRIAPQDAQPGPWGGPVTFREIPDVVKQASEGNSATNQWLARLAPGNPVTQLINSPTLSSNPSLDARTKTQAKPSVTVKPDESQPEPRQAGFFDKLVTAAKENPVSAGVLTAGLLPMIPKAMKFLFSPKSATLSQNLPLATSGAAAYFMNELARKFNDQGYSAMELAGQASAGAKDVYDKDFIDTKQMMLSRINDRIKRLIASGVSPDDPSLDKLYQQSAKIASWQ